MNGLVMALRWNRRKPERVETPEIVAFQHPVDRNRQPDLVINLPWEQVRAAYRAKTRERLAMSSAMKQGVAVNILARHLQDAIERVREDMEKVEFWADAVSGFSEPVPDYSSEDATVWLPSEQAKTVTSAKKTVSQQETHQDNQSRPRRRERH
jgi:hypothetical protein